MLFMLFLIMQMLFFFLDMCVIGFFSFPLFPFTITALLLGCYAAPSYAHGALLLCPALFHGLLLWGITGAQLWLCIAILLATRWALLHVHHQHATLYSLVSLYGAYALIKTHGHLSLLGLMAYTTLFFGGSIMIIYFSLKWLMAVKRSNRL